MRRRGRVRSVVVIGSAHPFATAGRGRLDLRAARIASVFVASRVPLGTILAIRAPAEAESRVASPIPGGREAGDRRGGALQGLAASGIVGRHVAPARGIGSSRIGEDFRCLDSTASEPGRGRGETAPVADRPGLGRLLADVRRDGPDLHGPADGRAAGRADQGRVRDHGRMPTSAGSSRRST